MGEIKSFNRPLATVFVLTYKRFDHIYANLDSIFNQDYPNIEIIVSDDGSTDFPKEEIINYIAHNRGSNIKNVIVLDNKVNVGTVRHINNLLKHATGDVYIPLSQDDEFASGKVVSLIMNLYQDRHFDVLLTSRNGVNKEGSVVGAYPSEKARRKLDRMTTKELFCAFSESRYAGMASGSAMYVNALFYKKVGPYDERYMLWEDGPFIHKCLRLGYKVETAYDIVSINYEQTEGISSKPKISAIMEKDVELYLSTDFQKGNNDFGIMHKRYINFFNRKRKCKNSIMLALTYVMYIDVCVYKYICSDKFML